MSTDGVGSGCDQYETGIISRESFLELHGEEISDFSRIGLKIREIWDHHFLANPLRSAGVDILYFPLVSIRPASSNPVDLAKDVAQAIADAKSGDWVSAAEDSLEVAKDIIDISRDIGEAFVESRTEAVQGDYAENSDIGFQ